MSTILVTGATGKVGSEVVKQLSASKVPFRAAIHTPANAANLKGLVTDGVEFDFNKAQTMKKALQGVEKVFLITPVSDKMVEMTSNFVKAAKEAGVKHIVKLSSLSASHETTTLGKWHAESEKIIQQSGIPYTFLRPTFFMQNFTSSYLEDIKLQGAFYMPCGSGKISLIDVRDVAAVAVSVLTRPSHENKTYNLTGPEALTLTEIADIFTEKLNKMVTYLDIAEEGYDNDPQKRKEGAKSMMKAKGLPDWLVDSMIENYRTIKSGNQGTVTTTVQEITGRPATKFSQFATDSKPLFMVDSSLKPRAYDLLDRKTKIPLEKKSRTGDETRKDYDVTYEHDKMVKKVFKIKIVYNMNGCTGSGHCALSDIYDFSIREDFKGVLVGGKEIAPGVFVKEVETTEPHLAINAAKTCTPKVIAVIDVETGKRIAP
ncbi:MAG TPA: SDR family oxidoreductase [archaeon]|nr:SDR family oxidoreductase [archaeon]